MKTLYSNFKMIAILLASTLLISCGGDDEGDEEPEVDNLVGSYVINSAILLNDLEAGGVTYYENPDGTDITAEMEGALLSASPCTNAEDTRLELTEDGVVFYNCEGSNESLQNGTWSIDEERIRLTLILNIPTSPVPVQLNMFELDETSTSIAGTINNLPLPAETFARIINLEEVPANTIFSSSVRLRFDKAE